MKLCTSVTTRLAKKACYDDIDFTSFARAKMLSDSRKNGDRSNLYYTALETQLFDHMQAALINTISNHSFIHSFPLGVHRVKHMTSVSRVDDSESH